MYKRKSIYRHIQATFVALLASATGNTLASNELVFSGIHAFGTSLSDEGNAFIACGMQSVPPYDNLTSDLNTAPGDSPYAIGGHRFSNGSTWVGALAKTLGAAGSALPVRRNPVGTNYAQAGTTAIPEGPLGPLPCRVSFAKQIADATARGGGIPADALVTVEIGSNDVINAVLFFVAAITEGGLDISTADGRTKSTILEPAADLTAFGITQLIAAEEPPTLLWANVPDIGLTPAIALLDAQLQVFGFPEGLIIATASDFAEHYNDSLRGGLQSAISDGTIVEFDLFHILQDLVNAGGHELNVTDTCVTPNEYPFACMNPDDYLFWDGTHPTRAAHEFFAEKAMEALSLEDN
jgi:outer membrane lipase/esterase